MSSLHTPAGCGKAKRIQAKWSQILSISGHLCCLVVPDIPTPVPCGSAHPASAVFQVVVPTRVGQVYIYDSPKGEQDEYDIPRHLLSSGSQEIYDVPPIRGGLISQYSQEVSSV